jgi:hypothetical protein
MGQNLLRKAMVKMGCFAAAAAAAADDDDDDDDDDDAYSSRVTYPTNPFPPLDLIFQGSSLRNSVLCRVLYFVHLQIQTAALLKHILTSDSNSNKIKKKYEIAF